MYLRVVYFVSGVIAISYATTNVKFPKDQRMNVMFPPIIELPSSPGLPMGHLRPLGRQQRSSGKVKISVNETWNTKEAQVFQKMINEKDIFKVWPRDADDEVVIAKRPSNGDTKFETMKFSDFIDDYGSEEWLLDQMVPYKLLRNIQVPKAFKCLSDRFLGISSSLTSGTTSDDIRTSKHHQLQCVLKGRRDFIVITKMMKSAPTKPSHHPHNICDVNTLVDVNPDIVNVFDNPWVIKMEWHHAKLLAGDCILLPADTTIQTTSYGPECETVTYSWHPSTTCSSDEIIAAEDEEIPKMSAVSPIMCGKSKKLELCGEEPKTKSKWQKLLESLIESDSGTLKKSCFVQLFNSEDVGEEMYKLFETVPVTLETISQLSNTAISKMLTAAHFKDATHSHQHDEL